ncbi:NAD(P)-dependent alcohol dehydrogenase [Flavobacterium sp.]|uniref:NAD(P)-dependent alcohol dehydrogenase n=1 Tax=Flavobacterium sp. TaxID=239 RepID=UPI003D0DC991
MKAAVCTRFGAPEVITLQEVAKPSIKTNEYLIKVKASAVNSADVRMRGVKVKGMMKFIMHLFLGFTKPRNPIFGVVFSGIIDEAGTKTSNFKPGDRVFGMTGMKFGAHAEYLKVSESTKMVKMPSNATFEEATALLFGGTTSIYFLEKAGIKKQKNIELLIYGASGAVGTSAVQLANYYGANVTAVCSLKNIDWIKNLGAHETIAYDQTPIENLSSKYDIVFDAVGKVKPNILKKLVKPTGKFITVEGLDVARVTTEQLELLKTLFEKEELKPVIDKTFPLDKIIEAHQYVDQGHKRGNVIINI